MMTALGVIGGVATHMSYCVAGLAVVITTTPWLFNILKYAGAAYLVWIGIHALFSRGGSKINVDNQTPQEVSLKSAFCKAICVTCSIRRRHYSFWRYSLRY